MIKINNEVVEVEKFPDGTLLLKKHIQFVLDCDYTVPTITWLFENNEELVTLIFLTKHLQSVGIKTIYLEMPYIPNARQDRVKSCEDVFTLKYFAEIINSLNFNSVVVLDPHSAVSEALINNITVKRPVRLIEKAVRSIRKESDMILFFPDEGAMKRYSNMFAIPFAFGIKNRDWETGAIKGLDVSGEKHRIAGRDILIVDDICSKGGTFYHSAKKLKEMGANKIYLCVTHCENTILDGELLKSGLIERVYTTNSIFTKEHEKIEVIDYAEC